MKTEDILYLLHYGYVSLEELEEILESDFIVEWENCGASGLHPGYEWYVVATEDGGEYNLYV